VDFNLKMKPFKLTDIDIETKYARAQMSGDQNMMKGLYNEFMQNDEKKTAFKKEYIRNNPSSFILPAILRSISYNLEENELEELVNILDKKVKQTPEAKSIILRIEALRNTAIGMKAPDFEQNDPDGKTIRLSEKIGSKLLLIDFWASWCAPCREENPNLVAVYQKFQTKGFDILGVSLDNKKENWLKAIADDKLTWTHVSNLKSWDNPAAEKYAVGSIPANFLLDENGVILAKNLRNDELFKKVAELID